MMIKYNSSPYLVFGYISGVMTMFKREKTQLLTSQDLVISLVYGVDKNGLPR